VEVELGSDRFEAKLLPRKSAPAARKSDVVKELKTITATAVGYYRSSPKPLLVGNRVESGDLVAEIIALGIAHEVIAKWSGKVEEVLVEPDQPVEYGQVLAKVDTENV
jgi:biotin carboxyl carrier protein